MRILVVEDDEVIAERLVKALGKEGYQVDVAYDGEEGLQMALDREPSAIVLDVMMPKRDGFSVVAALRKKKITTPVLMLTARDQVEDRVSGLDSGADDYLAKPFDFAELAARLRALIRRDKSIKSSSLHFADLDIDLSTKMVKRSGEYIHLTPREYSLLEALAQNEGRVLSRDVIVERIWGDEESLSNTVNFHVTSLRKKIDAGRDGSLIETVHGFGYRLRNPESGD
jgi:DNA-binding response OmpR family regulator